MAKRLGVKLNRLEAWERGERQPTVRQTQELARYYHRPFGVFFLPQPPSIPPLAAECRRPQSSLPESGNRLAETVMTEGYEHEAMVLDVLKRAVAEALERKRKLGQYAVIWREGRVVCTGPDAPVVLGVRSAGKKS